MKSKVEGLRYELAEEFQEALWDAERTANDLNVMDEATARYRKNPGKEFNFDEKRGIKSAIESSLGTRESERTYSAMTAGVLVGVAAAVESRWVKVPFAVAGVIFAGNAVYAHRSVTAARELYSSIAGKPLGKLRR